MQNLKQSEKPMLVLQTRGGVKDVRILKVPEFTANVNIGVPKSPSDMMDTTGKCLPS